MRATNGTTPVQRPPRYRIEHRADDEPALIVAFADTDLGLRSALAAQVARHLRTRMSGSLIVVDQETEEIVTVHRLPAT
ncbi:MAG: hypothetical protein M3Q71_22460 [Chloroflexota bacterium]|nr:hypothetical protein [Chloroflexota bacterium]